MHALRSLLFFLPSLAAAWSAPNYSGYTLLWQDPFNGAGGSQPDTGTWNYITGLHVNNELQEYTTSSRNLQLSGGSTVQLVPWHDSSNPTQGWTSARIESKYTFTPDAGRITMAEAQIRFGDNPTNRKKGMWPAFWMLGDSIRHGTGWPACGEVDILEMVNGALTGYGTVHCGTSPGGPCNENNGIGGNTGVADQGWHTWRVMIDRRSNNWQSESITWFLDNNQYFQVTGSRVNNQAAWNALAHSPLFFILNVAVGGNWPGNPDSNTLDGYGSMMEVAYVATYRSN
ncbi:uncharacterized protein E0L32_003167 [Thyridium curvatum]|uniref:GH16 domain-containing protein n=1 Tax=Thyridium curvatum TaxID=1093900 RepID=A0A507BFI4_9PEZI|nr:uncharacterized protein E0L32_003167 [Thyridium curvatum]TPX17524.1 hypothetical protein E0L32_003167 [Thyridium curvatum]